MRLTFIQAVFNYGPGTAGRLLALIRSLNCTAQQAFEVGTRWPLMPFYGGETEAQALQPGRGQVRTEGK